MAKWNDSESLTQPFICKRCAEVPLYCFRHARNCQRQLKDPKNWYKHQWKAAELNSAVIIFFVLNGQRYSEWGVAWLLTVGRDLISNERKYCISRRHVIVLFCLNCCSFECMIVFPTVVLHWPAFVTFILDWIKNAFLFITVALKSSIFILLFFYISAVVKWK